MKKVLSTKLEAVEIDRFAAMAEQQGESKAEFLRRLVLGRINSGNKADRADHSLDSPRSSKESLPVYHGYSNRRPAVSNSSRTGNGLVLVLILFALRLKYGPSFTVDRRYGFAV